MEKFGIKETKEAIVLGCRIGNAVEQTLEDGQVTVGDTRHFFSVVGAIKPALENGKFIGKELSDLSDAEMNELRTIVAKELDLSHDQAEVLVEDGFDLTLRIVAFGQKIAKVRKQQA
jgi:hypothetical protein